MIDEDGDWVGGNIIKGDKIGGDSFSGNKYVFGDTELIKQVKQETQWRSFKDGIDAAIDAHHDTVKWYDMGRIIFLAADEYIAENETIQDWVDFRRGLTEE